MDQKIPKFEDTSPLEAEAVAPPKFEETQPLEAEASAPKFEETDPVDENETPASEQPGLSALEGVGRGMSFGLTDALASGMRKGASALGVPDQYLDRVAPAPQRLLERQAQNPIASGAGEFAGNAIALSQLPQIGSKAINNMIQMGLIAGGDELSKHFLGQGNSLSGVITHIAENGALGLIGGKILGAVEDKGLKYLQNAKLGTAMKSFLAGIGHASSFPGTDVVGLEGSAYLPEEVKGLMNLPFKVGQTIYHNLGSGLAYKATQALTGSAGEGAIAAFLEPHIEKIFAPYISGISQKYVAPFVTGLLQSGMTDNLGYALDHAATAIAGNKRIQQGLEGLFKSGGNKALEIYHSEKDKQKLQQYMEENGLEQQIQETAKDQAQGYASGGEVAHESIDTHDPLDKVYPNHSMLKNSAKARMFNFLNSQRPITQNNLPFDNHREDPSQKRVYDRHLDLALSPLTILNHVKDGSLNSEKLKAFSSMYPDLHQHLSKKILERLVDKKHKEEKRPPHHLRQSLSLFLGSDLDSSLKQPIIAAAQGTFIAKAMQAQQGEEKPSRSKSTLTKASQSLLTGDQARQKMEQKP